MREKENCQSKHGCFIAVVSISVNLVLVYLVYVSFLPPDRLRVHDDVRFRRALSLHPPICHASAQFQQGTHCIHKVTS
jgi:hypothetical protein